MPASRSPRAVRPPLYWAAGNLAGGFDGGVTALWQLRQVSYRLLDPARKHAERLRVQALLMQLPEHAQLFSVCRTQEPAEVTEKMMAGLDPERVPAWWQETLATADWLCDRPPAHRRHTYLTARLPEEGGLRRRLDTATAGLATAVGRRPPPVFPDQLDGYRATAGRLYGLLGGDRELTPTTAGELRWLLDRASKRGIDEPIYSPTFWQTPDDDSRPINLLPAVDVLLDHPDDLDGGGKSRWLPRRHVTVRSTLDDRDVLSQQAVVVIAELPSPGWLFPGGELFDALDTLDFPVDWHAHVKTRGNDDARRSANRQYRQLIAQVDEWSGDPRGAPAELANALDGIQAQLDELAADTGAGEHETTITLQIGAPDTQTLEQHLATLRYELRRLDCHAGRPRGDQAAWWTATLPGATPTPAVAAYRQHLPSSSLAGLMPTASVDLGDDSGMLLALNRSAGTPRLVFYDPARGPRENRTGSGCLVGGLGSAKSATAKRIAEATLLCGGRFVTADRNGEYVRWAASLPDTIDVQVVHLTPDARICLDPMRVFVGDDRAQFTIGFLSVLTGVPASSARATALTRAVYDVADADGTTSQVIDLLRRWGLDGHEPARDMADQLDGLARGRGLARLVFDPLPDAPPLRLTADAVILYAPNLKLPSRETLANPVLAEKMLPEQVIGQAFMYLVTAIQRQVLFAERHRFALAIHDEAHVFTKNPWGLALLDEEIREARKQNAAALIISQDAGDVAEGELPALLACKWVGRLEDEAAARRALELLNVEPTDDKIRLLTADASTGQFLHRDLDGNLGILQVLEPLDEARRAAADTSPTVAMADQGAST